MEVLTAFVRQHASLPGDEADGQAEYVGVRADMQAALTVIGRRTLTYGDGETQRLDLSGTDLRLATFNALNLNGIDLTASRLEDSQLKSTRLRGAVLFDAQLSESLLEGTHLQGADMRGAKLRGAVVTNADFSGADLSGADLREAALYPRVARRSRQVNTGGR
jgi:uncharacterized protein YjbI with pentapeptide repeats